MNIKKEDSEVEPKEKIKVVLLKPNMIRRG